MLMQQFWGWSVIKVFSTITLMIITTGVLYHPKHTRSQGMLFLLLYRRATWSWDLLIQLLNLTTENFPGFPQEKIDWLAKNVWHEQRGDMFHLHNWGNRRKNFNPRISILSKNIWLYLLLQMMILQKRERLILERNSQSI